MAVPPEAGSTCVPTPPLDSTPTCWVLGYGSVLLGTWLLELTRQWEVNMLTAGDGERGVGKAGRSSRRVMVAGYI